MLRAAFSRGVYFQSVNGALTHNSGCLVEGLLEMGIPVRLCTDAFTSRPASMPLAGVDAKALVSEPYGDFSAYVIDISHTNTVMPLPNIDPGRLIYLNQSDIATFCPVPEGAYMFATHENRFISKPGRRLPLAFGLSAGLLAATAQRPAFKTRARRAQRNFRPTLHQGLRSLLDLTFVPRLEQHMPIERKIQHAGPYMNSLLNAAVCLAYGGSFYTPIMENPWFRANDPKLADTHTFARIDKPSAVLRWDSWRLWESFASGCVTVHLDFEKYGFSLPVMPEPWKHYVPIDLDDIAGSADALMDRASDWEAIAEQGRAWAIAHYAPLPTATYVFNAALAATLGQTS